MATNKVKKLKSKQVKKPSVELDLQRMRDHQALLGQHLDEIKYALPHIPSIRDGMDSLADAIWTIGEDREKLLRYIYDARVSLSKAIEPSSYDLGYEAGYQAAIARKKPNKRITDIDLE